MRNKMMTLLLLSLPCVALANYGHHHKCHKHEDCTWASEITPPQIKQGITVESGLKHPQIKTGIAVAPRLKEGTSGGGNGTSGGGSD